MCNAHQSVWQDEAFVVVMNQLYNAQCCRYLCGEFVISALVGIRYIAKMETHQRLKLLSFDCAAVVN